MYSRMEGLHTSREHLRGMGDSGNISIVILISESYFRIVGL
jgi:hypothetical protein